MIRQLTKASIQDLVDFEVWNRQIEPDIWLSTLDKVKLYDNLDRILSDINRIYVLYEGQKIIGRCDVIIMTSTMDFERTAYIDWLYISKIHRRKGHAKALLDHVLQAMTKEHIDNCYLFTAANEEAKGFYDKYKGLVVESRQVAVRES